MGYSGKVKLQLKARELRHQGFSIREIQKKLKVSKSSVSLWVRDVRLTKKQIRKLYINKKTGGLKGSIVAAKNKIARREKLIKELRERGKKEIGNLSKRDKFLIGVALYFSEGGKGDRNLQFCNSDPRAIKFMVEWFKEFCEVPKEKMRASLYLHNNLDEVKAKMFWSKLTKIPLSQFGKTYLVKNNPKRLRKTKHIYGVFRLTISDANLHRKIMGWTSGILEN